MAAVGQAPSEVLVLQPLGDRLTDDHRTQRHIAGVDALRHGEDVRHYVPVLAGKPATGAPEAGHHLVADEQHAVAVADLADRLQIAVGGHDDAVGAGDRLEDDGSHGVRPLVLENLLQMGAAGAYWARVRVTRGAAVCVRVEHAHDTGHARFGVPATRVAGQRDGAGRGAVVGAVAGDDLLTARVPAGQLDRVLVGLGAIIGEERCFQVARRDLGKLGTLVVGHRGRDRAQRPRLLHDGLDDLRVLMTQAEVHQLGGEVEVLLAVVVPEVAPQTAGHRYRGDLRLHRPGVKDVLLVQLAHMLPLGRVHCRLFHVPSPLGRLANCARRGC